MTRQTDSASKAAAALRARKLLIGAGTVAIMTAASPAGAQTITPQNVDPMQHFIDCLAVLFPAPDIHAQYCGPGIFSTESLLTAANDGPTGPTGPTGGSGPSGPSGAT